MCYHKAQTASIETLSDVYAARYSDAIAEQFQIRYHENGFSFLQGPVITPDNPRTIQMFSWGLVPWWVKSSEQAREIRGRTLNCISEEMIDKPSFRDSFKSGKRCLVPCTGFYEWRHVGTKKYPYFISLKDREVFSLAGLYSAWNDKATGKVYNSYTVLTTVANTLMEKIHNSKKRMPVILTKELEGYWLSDSFTQEDIAKVCVPYGQAGMTAYTVSRLVTDRNVVDKNVPAAQREYRYEDLLEP